MRGDRDGELLHQVAEFVDLLAQRIDPALHVAAGAGELALERMQAAAELGDLAGKIGGSARQVGDLAADIGAVAQPHRRDIVEDQDGQRRQRDQRSLHRLQAGERIEHETKRRRDQHHADGDENRRNADHGMRDALPRPTL